jgi:hypothetical protein
VEMLSFLLLQLLLLAVDLLIMTHFNYLYSLTSLFLFDSPVPLVCHSFKDQMQDDSFPLFQHAGY